MKHSVSKKNLETNSNSFVAFRTKASISKVYGFISSTCFFLLCPLFPCLHVLCIISHVILASSLVLYHQTSISCPFSMSLSPVLCPFLTKLKIYLKFSGMQQNVLLWHILFLTKSKCFTLTTKLTWHLYFRFDVVDITSLGNRTARHPWPKWDGRSVANPQW
jgi:hypothetical protein